jgi:hypothetical protein
MPADIYLQPLKARCEAADRALRGFHVALHHKSDGTACVKCTATTALGLDLMIKPMVSQLGDGEEITTYTPAMRCSGRYGRTNSE